MIQRVLSTEQNNSSGTGKERLFGETQERNEAKYYE